MDLNNIFLVFLQVYINYRINNSPEIRNNICMNGNMELATQVKFTAHVQTLSRGCFLYTKLLLDLIERGHLVLKSSSNFKILPVNLSEIFLLLFNLKFPTIRSFEKLCVVLNVCLASLYPLTAQEVWEAVNCGYTKRYVPWRDFQSRMELISGLLVMRSDGAYMFFHPAFR